MSDLAMVSNEHRTARKHHGCDACSRRIDPGELYTAGRGLDEYSKTWTSWALCQHCNACLTLFDAALMMDGEGWNEDTFAGWVAYRSDWWHELTFLELYCMAGYRAKWRTKSGKLWTIPQAYAPGDIRWVTTSDRPLVEVAA